MNSKDTISITSYESNYSLNIKSASLSKIQVVNFNAQSPETLLLNSNYEKKFEICQSNISNQNTSYKWRPPVGKQPIAICNAWRNVDIKKKVCGDWNYHTTLLRKHSLNVMSLFINPEDFFDFSKGIYTSGICQLFQNQKNFTLPWWLIDANWTQRGKAWERPIHFQYISKNGRLIYESNAGVRINGNATRGFAQKSLRIIANKKYGNKSFKTQLFENYLSNKFHSFILRNGGNDWGRTMCADGFIQSRLNSSIMDKQAYEPVVVYINGVYWGIHSLNERLDEDYFAQKYSVKKKEITILEGTKINHGKENQLSEYLEIVNFCKHNSLRVSKNFTYVTNKIDFDNLVLYSAIQIYCANIDWPNLNIQTVKINNKKNGRWFWAIRDLDCAYSYMGSESHNYDMFDYLSKSKDSFAFIFNAFMKTKIFRNKLRKTLFLLLEKEFLVQDQLKSYSDLTKKIGKEINFHINRWRKPVEKTSWLKNVNSFEMFIKKRETRIIEQINTYLN